jgi:uncharacterized lipoprotein YmbA
MSFRSAVIALGALAFFGCASSPPSNFYALSPVAAPAAGDARASYSVALGAVSLPELVNRAQIVTRAGANQVSIEDFERWAGPLKDEIARVIANNLTRLLNGASVFTYPQSAMIEADYKVLIDVQRFESALGDAASIEVLWQVRPAKGEAKTGRSIVREAAQGPGYAALVAAHSRALAAVSRDIASAIQAASSAVK